MTIDKAIEIKEAELIGHRPFGRGLVREADQLGIEALKRIRKSRPLYASRYVALLPGETKD